MAPPLRGTHRKVDQETLRRQCEVEKIPMVDLHVLYGYDRRSIYLYQLCSKWDITPFRSPGKYDSLKSQDLTPSQHQLVLGSVLGDGSIILAGNKLKAKTAIFSMTQGEKQLDYLLWKGDKIREFLPQPEPRKLLQQGFGSGAYRYTWVSILHPAFTEYRKLFYPEGKKVVTREILDRLGSEGLAIWLMDDGSYQVKSGQVSVATHSFSKEENDLAAQWFAGLVGSPPRVYPLRRLNQWFLSFNRNQTNFLRTIVQNQFFPPLLYKIGL